MSKRKINYAVLYGEQCGVTATPPNWEAPWMARTPEGIFFAHTEKLAKGALGNAIPLPPPVWANKKNPKKSAQPKSFFRSIRSDGLWDVLTLKDGTNISRRVDTGIIIIAYKGGAVEELTPGTPRHSGIQETYFTDDVEMELYGQHSGIRNPPIASPYMANPAPLDLAIWGLWGAKMFTGNPSDRQEWFRQEIAWDKTLTVGMPVHVYWGYGLNFRAHAEGVIVKVSPKSVQVQISHDTPDPWGAGMGWPAGFVLKGIPRFFVNDRWNEWSRVGPPIPPGA